MNEDDGSVEESQFLGFRTIIKGANWQIPIFADSGIDADEAPSNQQPSQRLVLDNMTPVVGALGESPSIVPQD